eukprot:3306183-Rhodomonas_salina.2
MSARYCACGTAGVWRSTGATTASSSTLPSNSPTRSCFSTSYTAPVLPFRTAVQYRQHCASTPD